MEAVRIRALQTEMMVAALNCNAKSDYNRFVNRFKPELQDQADTLKSYFDRVYGASGEKEMNRFITRLANESAKRSAKRGSRYCDEVEEIADEASGSRQLENIDYTYKGSIRSCRGGVGPKRNYAKAVQKPKAQTEEKPTFSLRKLWPF